MVLPGSVIIRVLPRMPVTERLIIAIGVNSNVLARIASAMPGSTKAVQECLYVVMPVIPHALELLHRETVSEHPR